MPTKPNTISILSYPITGAMWVAGRREFEKQARLYHEANKYEIASAIADRAPEEIYVAMAILRADSEELVRLRRIAELLNKYPFLVNYDEHLTSAELKAAREVDDILDALFQR